MVASPYVIDFYENITNDADNIEDIVDKMNDVVDKIKEVKISDIVDNMKEVKISDEKLCPICCEREIDSIYLLCGHIYSCLICSYNLEKCPICRKDITMRNKFYLA